MTTTTNPTRRARRPRAAAVAVILLLVLGASSCRVLGASSPSGRSGVVLVLYNASNIHNSSMFLTQGGVASDVVRTGSGTGSLDPCNQGLPGHDPNGAGVSPPGDYHMLDEPYHTHSKNWGAIYGRTWRANDKQCSGGNWRTALYIHTEETPSRTQGSAEDQRWDGVSDYRSLGCWKVARSDNGGDNGVGRLDMWWHSLGGQVGTAYSNYLTVHWG